MKAITSIAAISVFCLYHSGFAQPVPEIPLKSVTNLFLNVEDLKVELYGMGSASIDTNKLEQARKSDESKPENEDPKGNWGSPSEGFRMSLRLAKPYYTNGEPIEAVVLLRNISQETLTYFFYGPDWSLQFSVSDSQNHSVKDIHPNEPWPLGPKPLDVFPHTQRRLVFRIDNHFKFPSPGDYSVKVEAKVPRLDKNGEADASSGMATLKIAGSPQETSQ
jgi:hypothetical protein